MGAHPVEIRLTGPMEAGSLLRDQIGGDGARPGSGWASGAGLETPSEILFVSV